MEDQEIVQLYWERSERALQETYTKYENYCYCIAYNILQNGEDAMECVNDTVYITWNSIPEKRPTILTGFLGKITRNLSIDRIRKNGAIKRGGGTMAIALEELIECVPAKTTVEKQIEEKELIQLLNKFLWKLPKRDCNVFIRRYWYVESIGQIAESYGMSQSKVKSILFRVRKKLRVYLEKEGVYVG